MPIGQAHARIRRALRVACARATDVGRIADRLGDRRAIGIRDARHAGARGGADEGGAAVRVGAVDGGGAGSADVVGLVADGFRRSLAVAARDALDARARRRAHRRARIGAAALAGRTSPTSLRRGVANRRRPSAGAGNTSCAAHASAPAGSAVRRNAAHDSQVAAHAGRAVRVAFAETRFLIPAPTEGRREQGERQGTGQMAPHLRSALRR
jgi:hypothetical protein